MTGLSTRRAIQALCAYVPLLCACACAYCSSTLYSFPYSSYKSKSFCKSILYSIYKSFCKSILYSINKSFCKSNFAINKTNFGVNKTIFGINKSVNFDYKIILFLSHIAFHMIHVPISIATFGFPPPPLPIIGVAYLSLECTSPPLSPLFSLLAAHPVSPENVQPPVQRPASETQAHLYCSAKKNCTCGGGTLDPFIETIPPAFASLSTAAGKSQLGVFRSET